MRWNQTSLRWRVCTLSLIGLVAGQLAVAPTLSAQSAQPAALRHGALPKAVGQSPRSSSSDSPWSRYLIAAPDSSAAVRLAYELTTRTPLPRREAHDANYAVRGAVIGGVASSAIAAVTMGLYARRHCEPGLCTSDLQKGALVGGVVGLAAGSVLGWVIGSEIPRR